MLLYEHRPWKRQDTYENRVFAVHPADLVAKLSQQQIEQRELVCDPLGAAPEVPFGHIYKPWQAFVCNCGIEGEIWSFSSIWLNNWGKEENFSGYVHVIEGNTGQYFLTEHQFGDD